MSAKPRDDDGRVVVGLWQAAMDASAMQAAAELARLLSLDLHALFVEDEALITMASLPFAREIRLTTQTWSKLSSEDIEAQMHVAALRAQRLVDEAAKAVGIASAFEIVRGDPAACIATVCRASDILVVAERGRPSLPAGAALPREAEETPARSILLLPERPAARRGSIVAVPADARDPALDTACALAAATGEDLVILLAPGTTPDAAREAVDRARAAGLEQQRIATRLVHGEEALGWFATMTGLRERLIVIGGTSPLAAFASRLAAVRNVPVLLTRA